jgi:hypothetical protein
MGRQRFEVDGADAAAEFLKDNGVPQESVEVVWDVVALHTSRGIVERKRPEIALVSAGAGADVVGFGVDQLPKEAVAQVIAAFPRMGFKKAYQKVLAEVVARKPETRGRSGSQPWVSAPSASWRRYPSPSWLIASARPAAICGSWRRGRTAVRSSRIGRRSRSARRRPSPRTSVIARPCAPGCWSWWRSWPAACVSRGYTPAPPS